MTETILIRTTDSAGRAYTYASSRPNWAFRIALLVGMALGIALLVLVILPLSIAMILALFILEGARRIARTARRFLETKGLISSREGRKNVRVVER